MTDNGTEYVNREFREYFSTHGILHQTTCVDTPAQNGVAERKNRHLLEVAHSLMFTMNVPKYLWGEAILTAAYLINRMPLRALDFQTPLECLQGTTTFVVPPKIFGCVCFVRDHRSTVSKLDPRALKCVFVGYSASQKGYKYFFPPERRMIVSMDVTFRESEPYFGNSSVASFDEYDSSTVDLKFLSSPNTTSAGEGGGNLDDGTRSLKKLDDQRKLGVEEQ